MKLIFFVCILLLSTCSYAVKEKSESFKISGVSGKVLTNVQQRLTELKAVKPLSQFSEEELRDNIHKALQPYGYFQAQIYISSARLSITIIPGPPLLISSLNLKIMGPGSKAPKLIDMIEHLPLKVNQALSMDHYNKLKLDLINAAENLGYLHASFKKAEIVIEENTNSAQINLIFDTGILYEFGTVQFDSTYINPNLLHRFVPFKPGQPYSTKDILKLNNDLAGSGYFNSIQILPQINDSQTVPLIVHLQPVSKYSYTLGGGYGTDTGVRGKAALHINPLNSEGHKFNAIAQGSLIQNIFQAQYVVPGTNPVSDLYSLTSNFSSLNYDAGYSNSISASLAYQHNLDNFHRTFSLNGLYESFNYSFQPNTDQFLLYPKATLSWNHISNPLFSPSGYNIAITGLAASKLALSKMNMAQLTLDAKGAYTIDPMRLRLYGHVMQGVTFADDINQVPLSLALLLGGADNLKGYSFNSLGPGKALSYGGFEIQKETKKDWYVRGFIDAGTLYNSSTYMDLGLGLMWVSPVGPIKLGVAQGGGGTRLVVSMGPDL